LENERVRETLVEGNGKDATNLRGLVLRRKSPHPDRIAKLKKAKDCRRKRNPRV